MDECSAMKLNIKHIAFGCYLSPAQIVMVILSQSSFKFKTQFFRPKNFGFHVGPTRGRATTCTAPHHYPDRRSGGQGVKKGQN